MIYRVSLRGNPIQGLVDSDESHHLRYPLVTHYHYPETGAWLTEDYIVNEMGYAKPDPKWRKKLKVRADLASFLFKTICVEATSPADAKEEYRRSFGITNADDRGWVVVEGEEGDYHGMLLNKIESKLAQKARAATAL